MSMIWPLRNTGNLITQCFSGGLLTHDDDE
ncbi:hypothetical protein V1290_002234 [Bradyrhizobium sp. AZCC 1578]